MSDDYNILIDKIATSSDLKDCSVTINYAKPFKFHQPMECGISDIILPENLFLNTSITRDYNRILEDSINGNFVMTLYSNFRFDRNVTFPDMKDIGKVIVKVKEYPLSRGFENIYDLLNEINSITSPLINECFTWTTSMVVNGNVIDWNFILKIWELESFPPSHQFLLEMDENKQLTLKFRFGRVAIRCTNQPPGASGEPSPHSEFGIYGWFQMNKELATVLLSEKRREEYLNFFEGINRNNINNYGHDLQSFILNDSFKFEFEKPDFLCVYIDIVEKSFINNKQAKLLRRLKYKYKNIIKNILFVPLRALEFNSITINICDTKGEKLLFKSGLLSFTLFIQPIRKNESPK